MVIALTLVLVRAFKNVSYKMRVRSRLEIPYLKRFGMQTGM
jgi:hypothetical protein